ncbi:MAG: UbiA family prenyltransferase [Desulfobacterales bacterium]|jgi:4-hydroxybenzoate polyprenyltransferase
MANRWWLYQKERFPIFRHGLLIAAVCFGALIYSLRIRGHFEFPDVSALGTAFVTTFLFFLQLRIADEFKDYDEDLAQRPYRPVQRGLVRLSELKCIAFTGAGIQLGLALWIGPHVLLPLFIVWAYILLMTKEFFIPSWLKRRPVAYLLSHMLIMPLIYFYIAACGWKAADAAIPNGLHWLFGMGFFNGIVIEIGRKIRSPLDEEQGVATYSALWGPERATLVWIGVLMVTMIFALIAAHQIHFTVPMAWLLAVSLLVALIGAGRFIYYPAQGRGKLIEHIAGVWTLMLHLGLGSAFLSMP